MLVTSSSAWTSLLHLPWHLERIQGEIWLWREYDMELQVLLAFCLKPLCQLSQEHTLTAVIYYRVIVPVCFITDTEFYQAPCPLASGTQLLWSAKKPEILCQTLLINWERAWAQLQVALRKFQRALSALSSSQYEPGIISKSHSLHRAKLPFKDCATLDYCTWTFFHPKTAELSRSLSNDSGESRTQPTVWNQILENEEKKMKKKFLYAFFFFYLVKASTRNQNGQVPVLQGWQVHIVPRLWKIFILMGKIINSALCKSTAAKWMSHEPVVRAIIHLVFSFEAVLP